MVSDLDALVPVQGLQRFFGDGKAVTVSRFGEGHSNLTFLVTRGDEEIVLRRPPRGEILPGTHEMAREFKVMSALAPTDVPVPECVALCEDPSFIGAPFFLMSKVEGTVARTSFADGLNPRACGLSLARTLGGVHSVDWRSNALTDIARKPEEFLTRNIRRMNELLSMVRHREIALVDEAGDWIAANTPSQVSSTLTHGDFKLDNVILRSPGSVAAVVDWEISAIGDPLVDLGWMLFFHSSPWDGAHWNIGSATANASYPTRAEMVEAYASACAVDPAHLNFYSCLAGWKIAIIMEGSNLRYKQGMADDEMFATLDGVVPLLARRALDFAHGDLV